MIPGWDQGLLGVCKGEERHLVVPASLAYGDRGAGDVIPPDATLLFDIVIVDVIKAKSAGDLRREQEEEERRRAAVVAEAEAARRREEQEEAERRKVFCFRVAQRTRTGLPCEGRRISISKTLKDKICNWSLSHQ